MSVSSDLKYAKVFFSVVQNKLSIEKTEEALNAKAKAFRNYLGRMIQIKFTPEMKFFYDDTYSYTDKIESIFNLIIKDTNYNLKLYWENEFSVRYNLNNGGKNIWESDT